MSDAPKEFPFMNQEEYADVRTIAERAGVELRGDDGIPWHCEIEMQVKAGIWGPDYAKCNACGITMRNLASPHINGGVVFPEETHEAYGNVMWRWDPGKQEADDLLPA